MKNLSMHAAENEEAALELLFMGDTNRAIAETPMNMVRRGKRKRKREIYSGVVGGVVG